MNVFIHEVELFIDSPAALSCLMFALSFANAFIPPIPIEVVVLFAGYLAGTGHGSLVAIIASTFLGMFIGSTALYYLALRYGIAFISRTPLKHAMTRETYMRAVTWFQKYGVWMVFLGKLAPGMSFCTVVGCGVFRLAPKKAVSGILVSNLLFFGSLALIGEYLGDRWGLFVGWSERVTLVLLLAAGAVAFAGALVLLVRRS